MTCHNEIHNYVLGNLTEPAVCIGRGPLTLEQDTAPEAKRRGMKDCMLQSLHTVKTNAVTNPGEERGRGRREENEGGGNGSGVGNGSGEGKEGVGKRKGNKRLKENTYVERRRKGKQRGKERE